MVKGFFLFGFLKYIYVCVMDLQIDSEVACNSEKKTAVFGITVLKMIKGLFFQSNFNVFHCSGA